MLLYLKLQSTDNTIVAVEEITDPAYVCYQARNGIIIRCTEKEAQGIMSANGQTIYQLADKARLQGIEETLLDAFLIDEFEYETLKNKIEMPPEETTDTDGNNADSDTVLTMGELVTSINQLREAIAKYTTAERTDNDEATQKFYETLSDSSTNSIAKIRAAAQQYLDDTAGVADKEG
jgi:hypothetical protein